MQKNTQMNLESIIERLKENSLRITQARKLVAKVILDNKNQYLKAEDIFFKISCKKSSQCDQATVYRVLATFETLNIVNKSQFNNEASRYILNDFLENDSNHEHYFKCIECLNIESFSDCLISKKEEKLRESGYRNLHHHLEITGLCPKCAS